MVLLSLALVVGAEPSPAKARDEKNANRIATGAIEKRRIFLC